MVLDASAPQDDDEATRRRRAVEAGYTGDADVARDLLTDTSPRVRSAALGALARLEELTTEELAVALQDPQSEVRRRAAQLAALTTGPPLLGRLADDDPMVVEMAAWALGERPLETVDPAELEALRAIARDHDDALCREAAVAALGSLGDEDALPVVLAALSDKPAVRRRAVLALAAFEGEEVTDALRRATADRDWQVRQAAEDLLRIEEGA